MSSPQSILSSLFQSLFSEDELRSFVAKTDQTLAMGLPSKTTLATLADEAAALLIRIGGVDCELFDALAKERPRRVSEIRKTMGACIDGLVAIGIAQGQSVHESEAISKRIAGLEILEQVPRTDSVAFPPDGEEIAISSLQKPSPATNPQRNDIQFRMEPTFDHGSYPRSIDPIARFLLELEVSAIEGESKPEGMVAADLCMVLDVSASMDQPNRYPLLRKAVERLIQRLSRNDRVSVVLFSTSSHVLAKSTPVSTLSANICTLLSKMDSSSVTFGGSTCLAPALHEAHNILSHSPPGFARRVYVLTDGEIHDTIETTNVLKDYCGGGIEVHAYGFGTEFEPLSLRSLLAGQIGGSVKPICHERDIVDTFAHVAAVTKLIVATDAVLTVEFCQEIDCGDAWSLRPQEQYFGLVSNRRLVREIGAFEMGRVYSFLFETRLPPADSSITPVGTAILRWGQAGARQQRVVEITAVRCKIDANEAKDEREDVARAYQILDALRRPSDRDAELSATRAKRELAVLEGRDPNLISAFDKKITMLLGNQPESPLTRSERVLLNASVGTVKKVR